MVQVGPGMACAGGKRWPHPHATGFAGVQNARVRVMVVFKGKPMSPGCVVHQGLSFLSGAPDGAVPTGIVRVKTPRR